MTLPTTLPDPIVAPLTDAPALRWGVLAPGRIAAAFAHTLHKNTNQRIVAAASRSLERAEDFAKRFGVDRAYGDYRQLVDDPDVDIVYVAPPHTEHLALTTLALDAGKHVLVEKPITATAAEARELAEAARRNGRFAMEAMHPRFHPRITVIRQLLDDGVLGELRLAQAELGYGGSATFDPTDRLYDPAVGGGAALDLAVYPLWFHDFALGGPTRIDVSGTLAPTGVEEQINVTLHHETPALGMVQATMKTFTRSGASICGEFGRIDIAERLPRAGGGFVLYDAADKEVARFEDTTGIVGPEGLCLQAVWAARHIADGLTESPMHPLSTSIRVLETIDGIRVAMGATGPRVDA